MCAMPNAYVINQNKSTLYPRVDCGLPNKHSKSIKFLGENIFQTDRIKQPWEINSIKTKCVGWIFMIDFIYLCDFKLCECAW